VHSVTRRTEQLSPQLHDYVVAHSAPPDQVLRDLAAETADRFPDVAGLQIGPEQGTFMTLLTRLVSARTAVEVGTFTGYSSICIARGLAPDGKLTCCDVSAEWTAVAQRFWQRAGLADRIELRLRPALETLRELPADPVIDLAFIDADKTGYPGYWAEIVPRTRPGGVILVDNTLSHGRVVDEEATDPNVRAIREFNDRAAADERVELVLLPVGDGLTVARRR
jgi:caffeoyl-CoA O-methyltransferase